MCNILAEQLESIKCLLYTNKKKTKKKRLKIWWGNESLSTSIFFLFTINNVSLHQTYIIMKTSTWLICNSIEYNLPFLCGLWSNSKRKLVYLFVPLSGGRSNSFIFNLLVTLGKKERKELIRLHCWPGYVLFLMCGTT